MFSQKDIDFLYSKHIEIANLLEHRKFLMEDNFYVNLYKPATINDGILKLSPIEKEKYLNLFETNKNNFKITKFVPASGAASRMFQFLINFLNEFDLENDSINAYINKNNDNLLQTFIVGIEKLPFFENINKLLSNQVFKNDDEYIYNFIKILIGKNYYNYSERPKGIIPFYKIDNDYSTPVDKHLEESMLYSLSNGKANIHFTVAKDYEEDFKKLTTNFITKNKLTNNINYSFSHQNNCTDTIAWSKKYEPLKNNEELIIRPSGHGALLLNLNELNEDIVFIKNIDNVLHHTSTEMIDYKKILGGILIDIQEKIFYYLNKIENFISIEIEIEIIDFIQNKLNRSIDEDFNFFTNENKIIYLKKQLNRPIRVCGMVKNEGEPGGGPFWTIDQKGNITLQIVESTQINLKSDKQNKILQNATHFNPVDLVCSLKNYQNKKFNLQDFVDYSMGFMVKKSKNGETFIAYELPGLWNGSMAHWHTIFVEVPISTFNPVKTVVDLLKPAHQRKIQ
jgi:hypothetical protein